MKEWILKHPILTFLLVDGALSGIFNTIRAFAPVSTTVETETTVTTEEKENDNEAALQKQIENKEEKA
jgi:hypothetical protein